MPFFLLLTLSFSEASYWDCWGDVVCVGGNDRSDDSFTDYPDNCTGKNIFLSFQITDVANGRNVLVVLVMVAVVVGVIVGVVFDYLYPFLKLFSS